MAELYKNQKSWGKDSEVQGLGKFRVGVGYASQDDSVTGTCKWGLRKPRG